MRLKCLFILLYLSLYTVKRKVHFPNELIYHTDSKSKFQIVYLLCMLQCNMLITFTPARLQYNLVQLLRHGFFITKFSKSVVDQICKTQILGPLIFLLYANDIPNSVKCQLRLYRQMTQHLLYQGSLWSK